jgi:hypothetical protein
MHTRRLLIVSVLFAVVVAACGPAATQVPDGLPAVTAAPQPTAAPGSAPGDASQLAYAPSASRQMVIKNAEMELLVGDTDAALAQVTQLAADNGGYVLNSQTWYKGNDKYASVRLAVPSAQFENAMNYLRRLGLQVLRETASGQDVSAEYVDLQSRLANLEATAARVREFLAQAKTVEESLRVNQQLSELEAQSEQVKGQMKYYEGRAAFSTIDITLTPQLATPPTTTPAAWNPGATFTEASGVLVSMTRTTVDLLIWLVVVLGPIGLALGLILAAARWALRKRGA